MTSNLASHDLTILLGDGQGNLHETLRVDLEDEPHAIVVGDFSGDGLPDVVAAHISELFVGKLSVFRSLGDGSFARPLLTRVEVNGGENLKWLVPGDFNSDGQLDLVALSERGSLVLLTNQNAGTFRPQLLHTGELRFLNPFLPSTAFLPFLIKTDFTGDGIDDVVWPAERRGEFGIRVEQGRGDGTFVSQDSIYLGTVYHLVALMDLDRDGVLDLIGAVDDVAELVMFVGGRTGAPEVRRTVEFDVAPQDLQALALPGKGRKELFVLSSRALHRVRLNEFGEPLAPVVFDFPGRAFQDSAAADFDGDGDLDLALSDIAGGKIVVVSLDELGVHERFEHAVGDLPSRLIVAHFDSDGTPDLAVTDRGAPLVTVVLGPGSERARTITVPVESGQTAMEAADVDGDHALDLLVATRDGIEIILGDGEGGFKPGRVVSETQNAPSLKAADLDGGWDRPIWPWLSGIASSSTTESRLRWNRW